MISYWSLGTVIISKWLHVTSPYASLTQTLHTGGKLGEPTLSQCSCDVIVLN